MGSRKRATREWIRVLALGLSVLVLLFVFQSAYHTHQNGQDEAACRACQVAHTKIHPTIVAATLPTPLQAVGKVEGLIFVLGDAPFSIDSPSRAPPLA